MKITEIYESILDVLRTKEFVGHFEVTIFHPNMNDAKIEGHKPNKVAFPYDFSCELRNKINEICFKIVSGILEDDGDFTFDIEGQIVYLYSHGEENDC